MVSDVTRHWLFDGLVTPDLKYQDLRQHPAHYSDVVPLFKIKSCFAAPVYLVAIETACPVPNGKPKPRQTATSLVLCWSRRVTTEPDYISVGVTVRNFAHAIWKGFMRRCI